MSGEYESHISTDQERVRSWGREHDAVPVRSAGREGGPSRLSIVSESDRRESHEELTWEEFFDELDRSDAVVIYHGDHEGRTPFEIVDRDEAIGRASIDTEEVEEALLEGETITSELTETIVVEETIVEEATVESEVVDREVVEEEIVDAELLTREVVDCIVTERASTDEAMIDVAQFDVGHRSTDGFDLDLEVEVDEGWTVTKEIIERLTVESRVVDTGATETDTVVADTVDVEGVQQSILESDLVDSEVTPGELVGSHAVESEFGEGDTIRTQLLERKTVEDEVTLSKRLTGEIAEGETLASEAIRRDALESTLVDEEVETGASVGVATGAEMAEGGTGGSEVAGVEPAEAGTAEAAGGSRTSPTADEQGKTVVGPGGEDIGMVSAVEGGTMYVDPHPSLTDQIKAVLDWGDRDEDAYPVDADQIARIDDDRVELTVGEPDEHEG